MMDVFKMAITPVALIVGTLVGTWRLRLDARADLGLRTPSVRDAFIYSAAFLCLMMLAELMFWAAGSNGAPSDWRSRYGPGEIASRAVFAGLIYPISEELFFRGLLLGAIARRFGPLTGMLATAALFTALHSLQQSPLGALQIFVDGLFFAFVRLRSGSLLLPAAFHVVGNTFAVLQRL